MKTETPLSKPASLLAAVLIGFLLSSPAYGQDRAQATTSPEAVDSTELKDEASVEIRISAIVEGIVVASGVQPGDQVEKGQVLLELDPRELELRLRMAKAGAESAKAETMVRQGELEAAKSRLAVTKASGASPSETKTAESAVKIAEGHFRKAEASAMIAQMEIELRELFLRRSRIEAPVSGKVKQVSARTGEFVPRRQVVVVIERDDP